MFALPGINDIQTGIRMERFHPMPDRGQIRGCIGIRPIRLLHEKRCGVPLDKYTGCPITDYGELFLFQLIHDPRQHRVVPAFSQGHVEGNAKSLIHPFEGSHTLRDKLVP